MPKSTLWLVVYEESLDSQCETWKETSQKSIINLPQYAIRLRQSPSLQPGKQNPQQKSAALTTVGHPPNGHRGIYI